MWITDESRKKIEDGLTQMANGLAALPNPDEILRELRRFDSDFEKMQEKVGKDFERGIRRTTRRPL